MVTRSRNAIAHWKTACRRLLSKSADLGGTGNDNDFEMAFANLAHAYLADKAPALLDYEVGFQLIDRDDDSSFACGVFGFKVGSQWLYAPIFFINGDLKGHELLYIKGEDLFVPLKEDWINYLLNKKPMRLGDGVSRQMRSIGVRRPDFNQLVNSPTKYASWVEEAVATLDDAMARQTDGAATTLVDFLKSAGTETVLDFQHQLERYPRLAEATLRFHPLEELQAAIKEAARAHRSRKGIFGRRRRRKRAHVHGSVFQALNPHPTTTGQLRIALRSAYQPSHFNPLSQEQLEKLAAEGVLIDDRRDGDQVSLAYNVQIAKQLSNPDRSGLYDVFVRPGKFEKCFVALGPKSYNGARQTATVVRASADEGERNWINIHPSYVWTNKQYDSPEWRSWFDGLPAADSLEESDGHYYVLVGPDGQSTSPFRVMASRGAGTYLVQFEDYAEISRPAYRRDFDDPPRDSLYHPSFHDGQRVHLNMQEGSSLRTNMGDVYVPKGYKKLVVKLSDVDEETQKARGGAPAPIDPDLHRDRSNPAPLEVGNFLDIELDIQRKTAALKVWSDGLEVEVNGRRFGMLDSLIHLVRDHGLKEAAARTMLQEAQRENLRGHRAPVYRVKYANPYLTMSQPGAPNFPDFEQYQGVTNGMGAPEEYRQEHLLGVDDMQAPASNNEYYQPNEPDTNAVQTTMNAAQTGQREIFDTAMIGSLLKLTRDDMLIDRHLGDMLKGMNSIGRLLLIFYGHRDQFAERYGEDDLAELEDGLRNTFEDMGDLVLWLKEKTVDANPQTDGMELDLEGVASS